MALDVTPWVVWFTEQLHAAFDMAASVVDVSLAKAMFWSQYRKKNLSSLQRKAVNALLDGGPGGFEGGMSTRKFENLTGAARATASRDLIDLAELGLVVQVGAGRGTRYDLHIEGWSNLVARRVGPIVLMPQRSPSARLGVGLR